jgi:hypothetical protein
MHQTCFSQSVFSFRGFFRKNVAFKSVLSLDFPTSSYRESFLGTGSCFHLWHFYFVFEVNTISKSLFLFRVDHDGHALAF